MGRSPHRQLQRARRGPRQWAYGCPERSSPGTARAMGLSTSLLPTVEKWTPPCHVPLVLGSPGLWTPTWEQEAAPGSWGWGCLTARALLGGARG